MEDDPNAPASQKKSHSATPSKGRFFKLASMTTKLATQYAGHSVANAFRDDAAREKARKALNEKTGQHVAATLGELKGAVMKVGQLASQVADVLPEELAQPLKALQKEAPPMPFEVIEQQLVQELGQPIDALFASVDPTPYAAASIGQVHRARLNDGREVIVKVQYPGVAESCDSDLKQLKLALRMGRMVKVKKHVLDGIFAEIRERLHEELDYEQEGKNLNLFRDFFADTDAIVLPELVAELSTNKVLTLTLETGDHLDDLKDGNYSQELRNQFGYTLFDFMLRSLFELKAIHADPNPGNFAFRPDGKLVVYDFGCVKQLPDTLIEAYKTTIDAAFAEDWRGVDKGLTALGVRVPGSAELSDEFYANWQKVLLKGFLPPFDENNPFDFGSSTVHKAVMAKSKEVLEHMDQLQPPVETTYLDRMVGGHYWTMVNLGAQAAFGPYLRNYLSKFPRLGN